MEVYRDITFQLKFLFADNVYAILVWPRPKNFVLPPSIHLYARKRKFPPTRTFPRDQTGPYLLSRFSSILFPLTQFIYPPLSLASLSIKDPPYPCETIRCLFLLLSRSILCPFPYHRFYLTVCSFVPLFLSVISKSPCTNTTLFF